MKKTIKDIGQSESTMTEAQLQTCVACLWLKNGIVSMTGGSKLSRWLEDNIDKIDGVFGADDRVYIRCKTPEANKELVEFLIKEEIGDELQWKKCKGSDRWWLLVWWD